MTPSANTPPVANTLTAVVVSRGLDTLLRFCLEALGRALDACAALDRWTVVVVDNGSASPYRSEAFPAVELLRFDCGRSFAAANNAAVREYPADFYLLVNNDVLMERQSVADMLAVIAGAANVGVCGTRMLFPDGTIQHCGVVFSSSVGPYHDHRRKPGDIVPRTDRDLQSVTGACVLIRHQVWTELGGFDEQYGFGLEDIDFCLRARQMGWRIVCCNRTDSLHFESMTPGRVELDVASRALFDRRWRGRYTVDG